MASRGPDFEVHVMGKRHPKNGGSEDREGQLGACPFSMRVLMLLEEKEVPYRVNFIDVTNKPKWLSEVNPRGTVPVAKDLSSGEWFTDSGVISDFLEDKYADTREEEAVYKKKLGHLVDCPQPAPELWPKLWAYLKASEDLEAKAKEELCGQLKMVEGAVHDKAPYVGGRSVCAYDCALAPRLYIARAACRHFKGWDLGDDFPHTKQYLMRMVGRQSWRNAASWDDETIEADLKRELGA